MEMPSMPIMQAMFRLIPMTGIVEMTYYLKFEKSRALYFYVTYDKNTKQWTTRLA